jgi:hypothetical protein
MIWTPRPRLRADVVEAGRPMTVRVGVIADRYLEVGRCPPKPGPNSDLMTAARSHVIFPQKIWLAGKDMKYRRHLSHFGRHCWPCCSLLSCCSLLVVVDPSHTGQAPMPGPEPARCIFWSILSQMLTWLVILTPRGGYLG